jgi:hypothetical protein
MIEWQQYQAAFHEWQQRGGPMPQIVRDYRRQQGEARDAELKASGAPFRRQAKPLTMPDSYDPTRYDPTKPIYDYDPAHYDPADYEAWKKSRIAYQLRTTGNTANPFGPDGAASVRGKVVTPNRLIGAIVRFFKPGFQIKITHDERGIAAVEFALVAPVLILLMAVSFTLGMMQMAKQAVMFATQQAAVVQSTGGTPQTIFAQNVANTPASAGTVTCNTSGNVATCTGNAQFSNPFAGVLGSSATIALTYTAAVQVPQS